MCVCVFEWFIYVCLCMCTRCPLAEPKQRGSDFGHCSSTLFFLLLQSLFRPVIRMISNVFCISHDRFEDNFICVIVMTYSHTVLHIFPSSVELAENTASQRRCSLGFPCVMPQDAGGK